MSLAPGIRLGPYEVTSAIGAGGMGEVYRAHDRTLGRDVALKVLPDAFAGDPDRLARFEREAHLLASLNHPGIGQIYGLEEIGEGKALVLELVEGPTLADHLAAGALPGAEALSIASDIADALDAAHEKGVVHRDLKPANIKIAPTGRVKVLDFGLAKAFADQPAADAAISPTITAVATRAGVMMGTAAYMSPEQAQGKTVDKRADIWAFGCVLYEMLTGGRAFSGDSIADVVVALMTAEPDWTRLPATTPSGIRELLARCLRKDPRKRLRDIGDARIEIDAARTAVVAAPPQAHTDARAWWRTWMPWATTGTLAVALAVSWLTAGETADPSPAVRRLAVPLTVRPSLVSIGPVATISPDGRQLAILGSSGGDTQLYLHDLDSGETRMMPGTEGAWTPSFSDDGRWILFRAERRLMRIAVDGGRPQTIAEATLLFGAHWTPDDRIVYTPAYNEGLWQVSANGGVPERLTTPDPKTGELGHWWPDVLPDGRAVIYTEYRAPLSLATVSVYSFESKERKVLITGATNGQYLPSGHLVFLRERALYAVRFDPDRLEVMGSPVVVADDIAYKVESSSLLASFSDTGTLVYVSERDRRVPSRVVSIDGRGSRTIVDPRLRRYSDPAVSPDGRRLAVTIDDGNRDVWVLDLERGALTRVTFEPAEDFGPAWMPGGQQLIYVSESPNFDLLRKRADGTGQAETLALTSLDEVAGSVSRDGTLAYTVNDPKTSFDLWVLPPGDEAEARPFRQTPFTERTPAFSPDGRWIAYTSDESRRNEVYVEPFPGPGSRVQVSTGGGFGPVWARDGRTIFYWRGDAMIGASVTLQPAFSVQRSIEVMTRPREGESVFHAGFDAMPDGRLVVLESDPTAPPLQIQIVLNWHEELKRLAPAEASTRR